VIDLVERLVELDIHVHRRLAKFTARGAARVYAFTQTIGRLTESGSGRGLLRMRVASRRALLGWAAGLALGVMVCGQAWAQMPTKISKIVGT